MTEKELNDMRLHEKKSIGDCIWVLRVIGGWIYIIMVSSGVSTRFVPEFKNRR